MTTTGRIIVPHMRPMFRKAAVPSGFTPPAGCVLWLRADEIVGLNDGDPVATWTDDSGNGNDATQATGGNRPTYQTNEINGLPAVYLVGATIGMVTSDAVPSPFTIFFVAKNDGTAGTTRTIQSVENNRVLSFNRASNAVFLGAAVTNDTTTNPGSTAAIGCLSEGASANWRVNGTDRTDTSAIASTDWGTISLGASGFFGESGNAYLGEVLAFDSVLSDADKNLVGNYLERWGMTWTDI